jgi:prepilin-type N-terminal cleavage/methylation domain-containing protein
MKWFKRNEKGFTLVEILVAIPIMGLLGLAMVAVLIQFLHSHKISDHMVAVRQVEVAGDKVSQDGVQAQFISFGDNMTDEDWSLELSWAGEWIDENGDYVRRSEDVAYTLVQADSGLYELHRDATREVSVDGDVETTHTINTVALHLDASQMSCEWVGTGENEFSFRIVSVVGVKTEARTYNISPRTEG